MKRKIVEINEDLCNGCGLCVSACHEGAIQMVAGKARLVSDAYCDGLGDCLPACPTGAIQITEREAAPFDAAAVAARQAAGQPAAKPADSALPPLPCGCPGQMAKTIERKPTPPATVPAADAPAASELTNWPVQIKLVNVRAPYLQNAALLVAADCTAFAYPDIHRRFMRNKVTLIGCPKLDEGDYAEKLTAILQANDIKSVTVLRMEVPCCGGITQAVTRALQASGKMIPWQVVTVATDGTLLDE
ncbi:MAG TPA: 4Fe-4S binding protein [Kiritimatiellia bacterium]|jgi:ferredoxin|nr:MAG: 2-oxoglutarate-acceptor oxidoreductase subunit OorD [Verrucomicrobia bacterium ADurb.Bin018]HOE36998.1 4Fe-4S binding protein [Kiritimatiellia bacterium]HOR74086.1 4Fe-4S binding protein [Kiritimatiellia bacterium]HOU58983.1 4Fe-4S binding protein [Kiritimatiellia bacterium]HPK69713.1 4Fe-4S binding protein [Kiritimatiellia bacterium]